MKKVLITALAVVLAGAGLYAEKRFVMLDKVVAEFTEQGLIKKSGRGLL